MLTSNISFRLVVGFFLGVICALGMEVCTATQISETEVSVPKGIQDIVDLLRQSTKNIKSREDDLKLLDKEISIDAKQEDKYSHYYFQARAAENLGRINLRIELLSKSL